MMEGPSVQLLAAISVCACARLKSSLCALSAFFPPFLKTASAPGYPWVSTGLQIYHIQSDQSRTFLFNYFHAPPPPAATPLPHTF